MNDCTFEENGIHVVSEYEFRMNQFMKQTGKYLSEFLKEYLPQTDTMWWMNAVEKKLHGWELRDVPPGKLEKLDIGSLLTLFNKNYRILIELKLFSQNTKNFSKELHFIRNHLAHMGSEDTITESEYIRYLDTLERFNLEIGADTAFIENICEEKKKHIFNFYGVSVNMISVEAA